MTLADGYSASERVEIVRRRDTFDQDPKSFIAIYATKKQAIRQQIHHAQSLLGQV